MCVIMYKPSNAKLPNRKTFEKCFKANPDGAGYMFVKDNKVIIHKGFSDLENMLDSINSESVDFNKTALICHFRISTQGGVNPSLTHPFAVSDNFADMRQINATCNLALAHNGIISHCSNSRAKTYNDTMEYIRRYVYPITRGKAESLDDDLTIKLLKDRHLTGWNKFALMNANGKVVLVGDWRKKDGIFYSNLNWSQPPVIDNWKTPHNINNFYSGGFFENPDDSDDSEDFVENIF
ncbi:MAG: hypothetical protein J6I69_02320 [Bacilli bacterium]|nr:hypothetical protein [Bacilli bacterium]